MATTPSVDEYLPLLKTQKNEAFGWIEEAGFDPRHFEVGPGEWGQIPCTRFSVKDSPYYFDVSTARRSYSVRYSPGASELMDWRPSLTSFVAIKPHFVAWLTYLRREVEAPNLWAMVHEEERILFLAGVMFASNDPFTAPELDQVAAAADRARAFLGGAGIAIGLLQEANEKLDYLVDASHRVGHRDWAAIAFTVVWSIVVAAAFDPERARQLFEILVTPLRQLLAG